MEPEESAAAEPAKTEQPEAKPELWRDRPFEGGKLQKYAEQAGINLDDDEPADVPEKQAAPPKEAEKKPCTNCPPDEKTVKQPDSQPVKPEREPFATLKINGKDIAFQTKEDYDDYVGKVKSTPAVPKKAEQPPAGRKITRLSDLLQATQSPAKATKAEEDPDLDMLDPLSRQILEAHKGKISELEKRLAEYESTVKSQQKAEVTAELEKIIVQAREANPFEDVIDDDPDGFGPMNRLVFAGVVNSLMQDDFDNGREEKTLDKYFEAATKVISKYQAKVKGNGKEDKGNGLSHESLLKSHPDLVQEIRESAVADYLRARNETPPAPKAKSSEASMKTSTPDSRKRSEKGLSETFRDLERSPDADAFERALLQIK